MGLAMVTFSVWSMAAQAQEPPRPAKSASTVADGIAELTGLLKQFRQAQESRRLGQPAPSPKPTIRYFPMGARLLERIDLTRRDDVAEFLVWSHRHYKDLKSKVAATSTPCQAVDDNLELLRREIHELLREADLLPPISALLRSGYSLADSNEDGAGAFARTPDSNENSAAVLVEWETKHWADEESPVDFSIGGQIGFQPILTAVTLRDAPTVPRALYQNGFSWDVTLRANGHVQSDGEIAGYYRVLQNRLRDLATKVGTAEEAKVADVVQNGVGRWAVSHEFGVEYRLYGQALDLAHHEKGSLLKPLIRANVALRKDSRFRAQGALAALDDSEWRYVFRFGVNLVGWFDDRPEEKKLSPTYGIRFITEREGPMKRSSGVPSGNRFLLEADANILKLLRPGGPAATPAG